MTAAGAVEVLVLVDKRPIPVRAAGLVGSYRLAGRVTNLEWDLAECGGAAPSDWVKYEWRCVVLARFGLWQHRAPRPTGCRG